MSDHENTNQPSSMFDKFIHETQIQVDRLRDSAQKEYDHLMAHPDTIQCAKCYIKLEIPDAVWAMPASQREITCILCHTVTLVPATEAQSIINGAYYSVQSRISSIVDAPHYYHCSSCNAGSVVVSAPWRCQTCTLTNDADQAACTRCSQSLYDNKLLCSHCGHSTTVPSTGLGDIVRTAATAVSTEVKDLLNPVFGPPIVTCQQCGAAGTSTDLIETEESCAQCHHPQVAI